MSVKETKQAAQYRHQVEHTLGMKIPKDAIISANKSIISIETQIRRIEINSNGVKREYDRICQFDCGKGGVKLFGDFAGTPKILGSIDPAKVARAEQIVEKSSLPELLFGKK